MMKSKNKCGKILIMDSGIGGLTLLKECLRQNTNLNYIYFADYKSMPYGNKPVEELRNNIVQNVKMLNKKFRPDAVVLGCNTATAVSINMLRRTFPQKIIIGTEPAIMVAISQGKKNILVLATPNTIKYSKVIKEVYQSGDVNLILKPLPKLASRIENNLDNLEEIADCLLKIIKSEGSKIDAIVLGCTHYIFLKPYLQSRLKVPIYDGNVGVVKRIQSKVKQNSKSSKLIVVTNDYKKSKNLEKAWQILRLEVK